VLASLRAAVRDTKATDDWAANAVRGARDARAVQTQEGDVTILTRRIDL